MKKSLLALAIGVGLPFSAVVAADMNGSSFGPKAGDNEFTLSGGGTSNKQFDRSTVTLSLIYGKYITDSWQWSIRQGVNVADVANDNQWNGSTRLAVDYHWNFDRWRPGGGPGRGRGRRGRGRGGRRRRRGPRRRRRGRGRGGGRAGPGETGER